MRDAEAPYYPVPSILIQVRGGVIQDVRSSDPDVELIVWDEDARVDEHPAGDASLGDDIEDLYDAFPYELTY